MFLRNDPLRTGKVSGEKLTGLIKGLRGAMATHAERRRASGSRVGGRSAKSGARRAEEPKIIGPNRDSPQDPVR